VRPPSGRYSLGTAATNSPAIHVASVKFNGANDQTEESSDLVEKSATSNGNESRTEQKSPQNAADFEKGAADSGP